MHSLKLQLGARTLVARCAPALHIEAESVLRLLLEIESHGKPLREESLIPLGWSRLSLRARGDELVVCEPRFDGDALAEVNEDITRTLSVLVDQAALVQRLGTASQPTAFDRTITVACGALDERRIYVERREPTTDVDSGWYVGPSELAGEVQCMTMRVYQLLHRRPVVLSVLALPVGYLAAFDGDSIETVLDTNDHNLWQPS